MLYNERNSIIEFFDEKKTKNCTITELSQYKEIPLNYKNGYYIYEL